MSPEKKYGEIANYSTKSINAIIGVAGGRSVWFVYSCPECGNELGLSGDFIEHPTHDGWFFKGNPINCQFAGKKFKRPVQTIRLEEVKG